MYGIPRVSKWRMPNKPVGRSLELKNRWQVWWVQTQLTMKSAAVVASLKTCLIIIEGLSKGLWFKVKNLSNWGLIIKSLTNPTWEILAP